MDNFKALSKGMQVLLVSAVLLLIDTFFNWQSVDLGPVDVGQSAWHGFWGVLLGLMTIAIIVWVVIRLVGVQLPDQVAAIVANPLAPLVLGGLILLFAVLKNLIDDYSAWPSYVGIILAAGVAAGAWLMFQESGATLPSYGSTAAASPSPAASTPPPAASTPPPTPPPPPAAEPPRAEPESTTTAAPGEPSWSPPSDDEPGRPHGGAPPSEER